MNYNHRSLRLFRSFWNLVLIAGAFSFAFNTPSALAQQADTVAITAAAVDEDIWDIARGGQLYDNWMVVLDAEPPEATHPAYPAFGKKSGKLTWRCKECHGWDYMGEDGTYGRGAHFTGIKGVRNVVGMELQKIKDIIRGKTHVYTAAMIPDRALDKLALFLSRGQVGMDQYIDRSSKIARGDPTRGALFFQTICAICHGFDGTQMISKSETTLAAFGDRGYLGTIASDNPWETLHKIRNGQPGVGMVALRILSSQDQVDVLTYLQTLRRGR